MPTVRRLPALALLSLLAACASVAGGTYGWERKVAVAGLGNPLTQNGQNPNTIYSSGLSGAVGTVIVSRNRGETWQNLSVVNGGANVKQVLVHPSDSLLLLVAQEASPLDRIMKSTDGGASWSQTFAGDFSYFGVPVECQSLHPDTLYTMSGTALFRSIDFGTQWDTVNAATGFNAWCDAALRPDSAGVMYVGDATSGIWKTDDGGVSFRRVYATNGEIPMIAIDPSDPAVAYATQYAGGGGFLRTTDFGETWQPVPEFTGMNTWGVAFGQAHPDVLLMGVFEPGNASVGAFLSLDHGVSWRSVTCGLGSSANYGLLVLDSATAMLLQSDGLYTLRTIDSTSLLRGTIEGVVRDSLMPRSARVHLRMRSCSWSLDLMQQTDSSGRFAFPELLPTVPPFVSGYDLDIDPELPYAHLRLTGLEVSGANVDITALLQPADVLLVGEDSANYLDYYRATLDALDVPYNAWNTAEWGPAPVARAGEVSKRVLIYSTGTKATPIDSATLRGIATALDAGTHLFLTGQNLAENNDTTALFRDKLGVQWGGNLLDAFVTGVDLCDGFAFYTSVGDGAHNQTSRDVLLAPGGTIVLQYAGGVNPYPAAVRFDSVGGGSRVVVSGFGFESIGGASERSAVLGRILGYLDGTIVVGTREEHALPLLPELEQNYPNPFNPKTRLRFALPTAGLADLRVYDVVGREVAVLLHAMMPPGVYEQEWDAAGVAGGVYFTKLSVGNVLRVRKLLLLR
jgi:photosystem II stability/assembly factor-like uncharacterized protein